MKLFVASGAPVPKNSYGVIPWTDVAWDTTNSGFVPGTSPIPILVPGLYQFHMKMNWDRAMHNNYFANGYVRTRINKNAAGNPDAGFFTQGRDPWDNMKGGGLDLIGEEWFNVGDTVEAFVQIDMQGREEEPTSGSTTFADWKTFVNTPNSFDDLQQYDAGSNFTQWAWVHGVANFYLTIVGV